MPFGPVLDNAHTTSHFKCRNLCEQYSLDIMELCYTLAAAMEWYEKGIITPKDTEGIALEWGNHEAIVEMIHKIGGREGLGDLLGQGAVQAAKTLGKEAEKAVSHCKMMTMGLDDARLSKGIALSHATGIIPCHHEEGVPALELMPMDVEEVEARFGARDIADPLSYNKAGVTAYFHKLCTTVDALEICKFASGWFFQELGYEECAELFSLATGVNLSAEGLEEAGERINNLERAYFVREGFTREEAQAAIEQRGGKATNSVSAKTTALIVGESPGASKTRKAEELGIPIIDGEDFKRILEQGVSALD